MRAITIIAFTRARARASLDGSNIELSKVGNCSRSEGKNPRLEEPRKRTRGRDFTVGSRRNFYDRKPWQFGGLFFAIQRDHGYRNNTTRSPYLFPSDFFYSYPHSAEFEDLILIRVNSMKDKFVQNCCRRLKLLRKRVIFFSVYYPLI